MWKRLRGWLRPKLAEPKDLTLPDWCSPSAEQVQALRFLCAELEIPDLAEHGYRLVAWLGRDNQELLLFGALPLKKGEPAALLKFYAGTHRWEKYATNEWSCDHVQIQAESERLSQISHPAIPRVLGFGLTREAAYRLTEWVGGPNLEGEVFSSAQALEVWTEILRALAVLQDHGVGHDSLSLTSVVRNPQGSIVLTEVGSRCCHLEYAVCDVKFSDADLLIAPEALTGRSIGPLSMQFSAGRLGYRLFTGRYVYCEELPLTKDLDRVAFLTKVVLNEPYPPAGELCPNLPEHIGAILSRMMQPNPDDRFPGMREVLSALNA